MALRRDVLPDEVFDALAAGGGGAAAAAHLRAAQLRRCLLRLRGVRDRAHRTGHPHAGRAAEAYALLADVQAKEPAAAEAVLGYPTVAAWAAHALPESENGDPLDGPVEPEGLAAVAAAAAIRAGVAAAIEVPIVAEAVSLPSLGRASLPGERGFATVRSDALGAAITAGRHRITLPADARTDAPGWAALREVTAEHRGVRAVFTVDDVDPHRTPDAARMERRMDGAELDAWAATLQPAWGILVDRHPDAAADVRHVITVLTPMVAPEGETASATSTRGFGNVGVSAQPDPHEMAVTLAHEVQHVKLAALMDLVPLTLPDDGSRYYAPWRKDPRPLGGLLHGAYAHLAVAAFWGTERRRDHPEELALRAHTAFARWRDSTDTAIGVLRRSGRLTPAGEDLAAGMARVIAAMRTEPVPSTARDRAGTAAERHLSRWRLRHGDATAG